MNNEKIIERWKSGDFKNELHDGDEQIPDHPAGQINLTDDELGSVFGGVEAMEAADNTWYFVTVGCCNTYVYCPTGSYRISTFGCCPD